MSSTTPKIVVETDMDSESDDDSGSADRSSGFSNSSEEQNASNPNLPQPRRSFTMFVRSTPGIVKDPESAANELKEAESFICSLPDISYQVTKLFSWGKKRERTLKLTSTGLENIRPNNTVSSSHPYSTITSVTLKDIETLIISYDHEHDYTYRSPIAMEIAQEISCRVAIRRSTEKKKLNYDIAIRYQQKIRNATDLPSLSPSENATLSSFTSSPHLSPTNSTIPHLNRPDSFNSANSNNSSKSNSHMSHSHSSNGSSPKKEPYQAVFSPMFPKHTTTDKKKKNSNKRATKLLNLTGSTEQQRIDVAVTRILLSSSTSEGKTIAAFIKNANVLLKNPDTMATNVRQFIDGIKEYVLEQRAEEFEKLLVEAQKSSSRPDELSLANVVERSLQRTVILPLNDKILQALSVQTKKADELIRVRSAILRNKPQESYGISPEFISFKSDWSSAIVELDFIAKCDLPQDKMAAILSAARAIYNIVSFNRMRLGLPTGFLSADDFLPIFIFVVCNCNLDNLETLSEYLYNLNDPDQLNGESGYYLTVFISALAFIKNVNPEDMLAKLSIQDDETSTPLSPRNRTAAVSIVAVPVKNVNDNTTAHKNVMLVEELRWSSSPPRKEGDPSPTSDILISNHKSV